MTVRILLVDDHRMLRESLRHALTDEGFEIAGEASDGAEALEMASQLQPDVVLMDVSMPEMDGVAATREITRTQPSPKVVMLTMHADREVMADAIRAGAVGYLVKDCSVEELSDAIRMAASGETAVSPALAAELLAEVRRIDSEPHVPAERIISRREEEVLQLIADGCSTAEVAGRMYISQKTVKNHLASIYEKLDARDRTQAVLRAVRMGIIRLEPEPT